MCFVVFALVRRALNKTCRMHRALRERDVKRIHQPHARLLVLLAASGRAVLAAVANHNEQACGSRVLHPAAYVEAFLFFFLVFFFLFMCKLRP